MWSLNVTLCLPGPGTGYRNGRNDIALLKLPSPLTLQEGRVELATLPEKDPRSRTVLNIMGWGRDSNTDVNNKSVEALKTVRVAPKLFKYL